MDGLARAWEEADPVESGGFEASPDAPTPAGPREPASNYFDEEGFQDWYGRWSTIAGIDPNPDAPEHKYDYRAAYKVDAKPDVDESSGEYHWPSAFKSDDHPNRYIDNVDTKSGIDMQDAWDEAGAPDSAIDRKIMPDMPEGAYDRPAEKESAGDDEEYQKRLEKQLAANERAVPVIGKYSVGWLPDLIKDTDAFRDFVSGQAVDRSGLLLNKQRELLRNGKDLTDKEKAYLEDMQLVAGYNSTSKGLASFIPAAAEVVGQQYEAATSPEKNPYAMGMAAAGGAAATAAVVSGPGAVVTAPAAAAAAGGAAFAAGTLTRTSAIEAGQAFDEFRKLKDENGNTITLQQALFASDIVGSINGALEVAGLGVAAKLIPGVRNLFKDGVRGFLRQPTVGRAFVNFIKAYAQGWTGEVSTEMAQEMNNIVTSGILQGKGIAETMKDPQTAEQLSEIFDKVGKAMAVLGAVGGGVNLASDIRTAVNMRGDARTEPGTAPVAGAQPQKSINPVIDSWMKDIETGFASGIITKDDIQGMLSEMKESNPVKERLQKIIGVAPEATVETPAAPVAPAATPEGYTPATADDITILSDYLSRGINEGTEFKVQAATETKDAAMVQRVSGALGLKTVFFEGEGAADGVNGLYEPKSGTIFINSNAEKPHLVVLGHETLHRMHTEHPDLWDRLHFLTKDLKEDFDQYVSVVNQSRRNRGFKEISPEKVLLHQEFMADFVGQQFANPKFWEKLNKHDATLGQQAAKYVVELIEKIRTTLRGQKVADAKYFKQLNDVQDALASTYSEFARREKKVKDTTVQAVAPAVSVAPAGAGVAVVPGGVVPAGQTAPVAPAASQVPGLAVEGAPVGQPSATPTAEEFAGAEPVADAVPVVAGEPVTEKAAQLAAETTVPAPQGEAIAPKAEPLAETAKETKPAAVEEKKVKTEAVEETKPKTKAAPPSAKASRITTLRGAIMKMGGINIGNMKGEFKDVTTGTKFLLKKTGEHLDIAEQRLKADGWLREDENLVDVLRSPENLRRNKVAGEGVAKREQDMTEQEKREKKEMEYEPEAPPEGDYVMMEAADLPEGKKLTIIDDSVHGWDLYEVTEKDAFGVTLKDGRTIELKPGEKVQVRHEDLGHKAEAAVETKPAVDSELEGIVVKVPAFDEKGNAGEISVSAQDALSENDKQTAFARRLLECLES